MKLPNQFYDNFDYYQIKQSLVPINSMFDKDPEIEEELRECFRNQKADLPCQKYKNTTIWLIIFITLISLFIWSLNG